MVMRYTACLGSALLFAVSALGARGDDVVYRYEGDVLLIPDAGWFGSPCEPPCEEFISDGHFVLRWPEPSDFVGYAYVIAGINDPPPPLPVWIEWAFLSSQPFNGVSDACDAGFTVDYRDVHELNFLFGDTIISPSGDDVLGGFALGKLHTFRFESLDGRNYCFHVDGQPFRCGIDNQGNAGAFIEIYGHPGCSLDALPKVNEWDFVRYGTITYGEQIVSSDPPQGFVDARVDAMLDRFTVTYDSPNYVYIDEIAVTTTGGVAPAVIATRRLDNGPPETVEIVLDRPIPYNATTRFTFNDGVAVQSIEYTFAPGDTDGDGDADLFDFAAFQNCFGNSPVAGVCLSLDFNADSAIDLLDFAAFAATLSGR